jgi:hypothetical protein
VHWQIVVRGSVGSPSLADGHRRKGQRLQVPADVRDADRKGGRGRDDEHR